VFEALGEPDRATELRGKAAELQRRFEDALWCEDTGFYALALDPDKQPVKTISSNAVHLLRSSITYPERAGNVVKRLLEPDMWSGWGTPHAVLRQPGLQPAVLLGVASRHRHHRHQFQALRFRRGRRPQHMERRARS